MDNDIEGEKHEYPDDTTIPTQATREDDRADNSARSNGVNTDTIVNADPGIALANASRHVHPTDDGKTAKLVLTANTVSLADVKRSNQSN